MTEQQKLMEQKLIRRRENAVWYRHLARIWVFSAVRSMMDSHDDFGPTYVLVSSGLLGLKARRRLHVAARLLV